jgi:plasmid stabilization system protein ParE
VSLPITLRAEAEAEFDEAFDFYEGRRAGRGEEVTAEVQAVFDQLAANPLIHLEVFADIRKAVVRGFPYCIYCHPHADRVEILAVFHTSRDPFRSSARATG